MKILNVENENPIVEPICEGTGVQSQCSPQLA